MLHIKTNFAASTATKPRRASGQYASRRLNLLWMLHLRSPCLMPLPSQARCGIVVLQNPVSLKRRPRRTLAWINFDGESPRQDSADSADGRPDHGQRGQHEPGTTTVTR